MTERLGAGLVAETLGLLMEPLGVDSVVGAAAVEELIHRLAEVARDHGVPDRPTSGSTLRVVEAFTRRREQDRELVARVTDRGGRLPLDQVDDLRALAAQRGLSEHLRSFEGVTVEVLRASLAEVASAERSLAIVLAECRRAEARWPIEFTRSVLDLEVESAAATLRRRASRQAARLRDRVLDHSRPGADRLSNRELADRLDLVLDVVVAREAYESVVLVQPSWWRWLGPQDVRLRVREDRCAALRWAIHARDTGALSVDAVDLLADPGVRAVLVEGLPGEVVTLKPGVNGRLAAGLAAFDDAAAAEAPALHTWWRDHLDALDRVAAAMDALPDDPALRERLDTLVAASLPPFGVDPSRAAYRDIQTRLRATAALRLPPLDYSAYAVESERLVGVIGALGAIERDLHDAVRSLPAPSGPLRVAIVGCTKSGKTTLRKALLREADRDGIGRGAHRTTRETSAFELGSVVYLDTPGLAAKDDDFDAARAREAWEGADAVLWNYADTLREEEAAEFCRILRAGKPMLAVVNVKRRVDDEQSLRAFVRRPDRLFAAVPEHARRIEQVAASVGAGAPTVLPVHAAAAHEALSLADRDLGDQAFVASRLPELEASLRRLLAERSIPLRALRLADHVRGPVVVTHERLLSDLPPIDRRLRNLKEEAPRQREAFGRAVERAGRDAHDRLDATRHLTAERLATELDRLGRGDHARRWSQFLDGLALEQIAVELYDRIDQAAREHERVLPSVGGHDLVDEPLAAVRRPRTSTRRWAKVAARGTAGSLMRAVTTKVKILIAVQAVTGVVKAVSEEVDRANEAGRAWTTMTAAQAETVLNVLFARIGARLTEIVDTATAHAEAHFDGQKADIVRIRDRYDRLNALIPDVVAAFSAIDDVLDQRLCALEAPASLTGASR
ncbi:MAG: GTPase domain-containing protein [Aeromicrobium sp.]|uniref:GTPase n=1 Tax=Aeromicrobium sp. TaxID=1871063 RepID=UPI0039E50E4B